MRRMTQKQYRKNAGTKCPYCRSEMIEGQEVNIEAGEAWQEIRCLDCDATWRDIYTLSCYERDNE